MARNTKSNKVMGIIWYSLFILISLLTLSAQAQEVQVQGLDPERENPVYFGYTIAGTSQTHTVKSNLAQIDGLNMTKAGGSLGIMFANRYGKLKSNLGIYYSSASSRVTSELLDGGVSGSVYLLRLKGIKSHLFEPYMIVDITGQRSTFYGAIEEGRIVSTTCDKEVLTRIKRMQATIGAGLEYQLENDSHDFIHFFAEARVGGAFFNHSSNPVFSDTEAKRSLIFSVGVSFGKFR